MSEDPSLQHSTSAVFLRLTAGEKSNLIQVSRILKAQFKVKLAAILQTKLDSLRELMAQVEVLSQEFTRTVHECAESTVHQLQTLQTTITSGLPALTHDKCLKDLVRLKHEKELHCKHSVLCVFHEDGTPNPELEAYFVTEGERLYNNRDYAKAISLYRKALEMQTQQNGQAATILNNIGIAHRNLGQSEAALEAYMKSLQVKETVYGPTHAEVGLAMNNIGVTYGSMGQHSSALSWLLKSLELRRVALSPGHLDIAETLHNLGFTLFNMGRFPEAQEKYEEAVNIRRQEPSARCEMSMTLNNIGVTLHSQGNYDQALEAYFEALNLQQEAFGKTHVQVSLTLHNIAFAFEKQRKLEEAFEYYEQAYAIKLSQLGEDHPSSKNTLDRKAALARRLKK